MSSASNKNAGSGVVFLIILVVAALVGLFVAVAVTASDEPDDDGATSVSQPAAAPAEDPGLELPLVQLDGQWTAEANGSLMIATVANSAITVKLQSDGSEMVYWNGTFKTAESPGGTILSTLVETNGLVLSSATEKNFVVQQDTISFELTAMGRTTTVVMNRV